MYRRTVRVLRSGLSGPVAETATTLIVVLLGFALLGNGLKLGTATVIPGAGGMPALTPYLFQPHDAAGFGTLIRFAIYVTLTLIVFWLGLRIIVAFLLARQSGFSPSSRVLAFLRLAPVRGAGATIGTLFVTAGGSTAHAASAHLHQAARPAIVATHHAQAVAQEAPDQTHFFSTIEAADHTAASEDAHSFFVAEHAHAETVATHASGSVATHAAPRAVKQAFKTIPALSITIGPGDSLSAISERVYGTPYRYMDIFRASQNIVQYDGSHLTNPNELQVGWRVNVPLPAQHFTVDPKTGNGIYIVQPGDTASGIAKLVYGDWSRYPEIINASRSISQPDGMQLTGDGSLIQPGMVLELPGVQTVTRVKLPAQLGPKVKPKAPLVKPKAVVKGYQHRNNAPTVVEPAMPPKGIGAAQAPHSVKQVAPTGPVKHHYPVRPTKKQVTTHKVPAAPAHQQATKDRVAPTVREPFSSFVLPTALLALLFMASAAVLLQRRRKNEPLATPAGAGRVLPTMLKAMHAAQSGIPSPTLKAAKGQMSGNEGPRVAFVLAALQQAGGPLGMGIDIVRMVVERADGIDMYLAVRGIDAARRTRLADALGRRLGVAVGVQPGVDGDGTPIMTLSVAQGPVPAAAAPYPTPAPLVLPVGRVSSGDVVYLNMSQTDSMLVAGSDHGPSGLIRLLVTSLVMQAEPSQVKMLVASRDQNLRSALAATGFLLEEAIDPENVTDLANLIARADAISMDRFTADEDPATQPFVLVVIDDIENIAGSPALCENLQALCRQGRDSKIHVLATTGSPSALVDSGLMDLFKTRLAYHLDPVQSQELFGDDTVASELSGREIHLHGVGPDQTLTALELDRTVMEDMIARRAVALMPNAEKNADLQPTQQVPVTAAATADDEAASDADDGERPFLSDRQQQYFGTGPLTDNQPETVAPPTESDFFKEPSWEQHDPWQEATEGGASVIAAGSQGTDDETADDEESTDAPPAAVADEHAETAWQDAASAPGDWAPVESAAQSTPASPEDQHSATDMEDEQAPQWDQHGATTTWATDAAPSDPHVTGQLTDQDAGQDLGWGMPSQAEPQPAPQDPYASQWQQPQPGWGQDGYTQEQPPAQWGQPEYGEWNTANGPAQPGDWQQARQAAQWQQQMPGAAAPAEGYTQGWEQQGQPWTTESAWQAQQPQEAPAWDQQAAQWQQPTDQDGAWQQSAAYEAPPEQPAAPAWEQQVEAAQPEQMVREESSTVEAPAMDDAAAAPWVEPAAPQPAPRIELPTGSPVRTQHDEAVREALTPFDPDARIEIRMLNGVNIYLDGHPITATFREQPIIILGIIGLLGPGPVAAETIIDRLAQQGPPVHRNAKTIARAISRLREHLQAQGIDENPVVWSNAGGYELARGVATCDLYNLVKLKERMNTVDRDDRHYLWERFADSYSHDVWTYNRPPWVTAYAERWRKDYVNYLYRLANWYLEQGNDPNEALMRAQQLFNEEPSEERAAILMIDLLGERGDLDGLEQFYARLCQEREQEGGSGVPSESEQNHYARWKQRMIESA